MRVLIASNACPPNFMGGAELMAHEQARALVRLGHEVRVFAGDLGPPEARHERIDAVYDAIPVHRIGTVPEDYSPEYFNFLHPRIDAHFRDVLRDFRPHVVHCHNLTGLSVKLPVIARRHGARVVCTLHDFWGFCLRNTAVRPDGTTCDDVSRCRTCLPRLHDGRGLHVPLRLRKDFMRLALDHVDRFVAPSRYLADRYAWAGLDAGRVTVLPNGVDVARFRPAPGFGSQTVRITYVGYFGAHKGVVTLLEALALLPPGAHVELQLAGEGPEKKTYLARIAALGLDRGDAARVCFLGKVAPADMPGVYARSDIIVLPSVWEENQPVCLMEAMAAGLPIVASRKGGIAELVMHGENGLMFAAGDSVDLAAQLAHAIGDPDWRRAAGRKGRARVEALDHDRQAARLLDIYGEILADRRGLPEPVALFAALGDLRGKTPDEHGALALDRNPNRRIVPPDWIADETTAFRGVVLTGRIPRILRLVGINVAFGFPGCFGKAGNALLRRFARLRTDPTIGLDTPGPPGQGTG